ncbi:MAG TPA: type II CAAX endopeptidase family protein [Bryobacterales bacterium]|nr:type II CAAX endopeptidase family protein [Bryobacterales bacterium]
MLPDPVMSLPDESPPIRRFVSGVGQATAFGVLTVILWWLCAWLIHDQPWVENELVITVLSLTPAVWVATAFLLLAGGRYSWEDLGLAVSLRGLRELAGGVLGGAAIALSVVGTLWSLGWIVAVPPEMTPAGPARETWEPAWSYAVVILFLGAAAEELLFRGFALQQLIRASNVWVAVMGTSILFGLLHAGNPGASNVGLVNTALFGCLFGFLLVRTRSLAIPIGVHFGWNFTLVAIGVNVSGIRIKLADMTLGASGPTLWSGGAYGPEASLITSLAVPLVICVVLCLPPRANSGPRLWD